MNSEYICSKQIWMTPQEVIDHLGLLPHPEGGHYREIYCSEELTINKKGAPRYVCTAIHYLLEGKDRSHFHRIQSDELWFFHLGRPVELVWLVGGEAHHVILGTDLRNGETLFHAIPANTWFGCRLMEETGFALVSCTVSPGFDFADFELADRDALIRELPSLAGIIAEFTRG